MDGNTQKSAAGSRRTRVAKRLFVIGLLFTITGISGIVWSSLPVNGTVQLNETGFLRLDGRSFGRISVDVSCLVGEDAEFVILDQNGWNALKAHTSLYPIKGGDLQHLSEGDATRFSANLPASEAYYLYVISWTYSTQEGYGPVTIEIHWSVWGPVTDYFPMSFVLCWLGFAFVLYGNHTGLKLKLKGKMEEG